MKQRHVPGRVLTLPVVLAVAVALVSGAVALRAQEKEPKPVPKNSVRVAIPGCSKGVQFLASRPAEDQPGGSAVPEGTVLRMNGPKPVMNEIKGHEGSRIEITGLIKKGQERGGGVQVGRGVRIGGGGGSGPSAPLGGGIGGGVGVGSPGGGQLAIDVEGWRQLPGDCPR